MPRVHTSKARRDYPEHGIKRGDTYYHWSFYRGPKMMSKERPKGSQLTQREELVAMLEAQEAVGELDWSAENRESLASEVRAAAEKLGEAASYADDKYGNLPENFQNGDQGSFLQNFSSECQDAQSELESIADALEDLSGTAFDEIDDPNEISWPSEG